VSDEKETLKPRVLNRWSQVEGVFLPAGETSAVLPPGIYDLAVANGQTVFIPVQSRTDDLIRFPSSATDAVVAEIEAFWQREDRFREHGLPYKRGILLYGPPGSGKSCTLQLIERDVIARGGVCLIFQSPSVFLNCYRVFRMVEPDTPVVVVMEDLDAILERQNESSVLNLLDGAEQVDRVVFLATTNYPEKLSARITNRPSRFDRRYKIPHPADAARELYLESLLHGEDVDVAKWVRDTRGMSLAHLKELFVGTVLIGTPYNEVLGALREMSENKPGSWDDDKEFARQMVKAFVDGGYA